MNRDYSLITELAGDPASHEQVQRLNRRYHWAAGYAQAGVVLEVACGAGQGLGLLARHARQVVAADISPQVLAAARRHYGAVAQLLRCDAEALPFGDTSFDLVLMFEAIYYLSDPAQFIGEAWRVLRPGGTLLLSSANKDLRGFTRSAMSTTYLSVPDLASRLESAGFSVRCFGDTDASRISMRQRVLLPFKALASQLNIMPTNKQLKAALKRVMFGEVVRLPAEVLPDGDSGEALHALATRDVDVRHKVICYEATKP